MQCFFSQAAKREQCKIQPKILTQTHSRTSTPEMPSLSTLPMPIPTLIMESSTDLISLNALRLSNPLFHAAFQANAVHILETLLQRTLLYEVVVLVRIYVLLLQRGSHTPLTPKEGERVYTQAQNSLPPSTSTPAILHALHTFSHLSSASTLILDEKLVRLADLPYSHFADPSIFRPYQQNPTIIPPRRTYTVPAQEPLDWIEEQRGLRGVWGMWIQEKFPGSDVDEDWRRDEVEEMTLSIQSLNLPKEFPISWTPLAAPPSTPSDPAFSRAHRPSHGYAFFHGVCQNHPTSHLRGTDWSVLRSLGLGIWSKPRMASLGLFNHPREIKPSSEGRVYRIGIDEYLTLEDLLFTWWKRYQAEMRLLANEGE